MIILKMSNHIYFLFKAINQIKFALALLLIQHLVISSVGITAQSSLDQEGDIFVLLNNSPLHLTKNKATTRISNFKCSTQIKITNHLMMM